MASLDRPREGRLSQAVGFPQGTTYLAKLGVLLEAAGLTIELGEHGGLSSLRVLNRKRPDLSCRVTVKTHPERGGDWFWYSSWNGSICPVTNAEAASRDVQGWLLENRTVRRGA